MTIKEVAEHLWPCWTGGLVMLHLVKNSKYNWMLRVDKEGLLRFAKWMVFITIVRVLAFKFATPDAVLDQLRATADFIPWQTTFGVFWEDACHTMPLALGALLFQGEKWWKWVSKPLLAMVMASFGLGHLYQGLWACFVLAFYIPVTMKLAKKYGFGTVMLCHMAYDLLTLLTVKLIV